MVPTHSIIAWHNAWKWTWVDVWQCSNSTTLSHWATFGKLISNNWESLLTLMFQLLTWYTAIQQHTVPYLERKICQRSILFNKKKITEPKMQSAVSTSYHILKWPLWRLLIFRNPLTEVSDQHTCCGAQIMPKIIHQVTMEMDTMTPYKESKAFTTKLQLFKMSYYETQIWVQKFHSVAWQCLHCCKIDQPIQRR